MADPNSLPRHFARVNGERAAEVDLAAELRRAVASGEVIKDEEETLLVRAADRWWKLYRIPPRRQLFAGFARSRGLREWRALRHFAAAGLPVILAEAFAEARSGPWLRASLLVTRDLAGGRDLGRLWQRHAGEADAERRLSLAEAAGRAAARLHGAGFGHFRMQLRNLLLGADGRVHWLDAPYACQWPESAPRRVRTVNLVDLCGVDSPLAVAEAEACLLAYAAAAGWAPPLALVRGRGRLAQKLRRIAYYLLAVNGGRRISPTS